MIEDSSSDEHAISDKLEDNDISSNAIYVKHVNINVTNKCNQRLVDSIQIRNNEYFFLQPFFHK